MVEPKFAEFWNPSASWSVLQSVSSLTLFRQCSHFDMLQVHGFPHNHPKDCWLISTCEIPVALVPTCPKWFLSPFGFINGLLPPFLDRPQFLLVKQLHFAGCKFLSMWPPGPVTWTSSRNFLSKAPCWDGTWWGLNQNWETPPPVSSDCLGNGILLSKKRGFSSKPCCRMVFWTFNHWIFLGTLLIAINPEILISHGSDCVKKYWCVNVPMLMGSFSPRGGLHVAVFAGHPIYDSFLLLIGLVYPTCAGAPYSYRFQSFIGLRNCCFDCWCLHFSWSLFIRVLLSLIEDSGQILIWLLDGLVFAWT